MKFKISSVVCDKIPGIQVAVLVFRNLKNNRKSSPAMQLLCGAWAQKKSEWKNDDKFKYVNELIKKTQVDGQILPETQLLESTARKIKRGNIREGKNNLYALAHYLSIKYMVPLSCEDLDLMEKDLQLDFITPSKGKKARDFNVTEKTENAVFWLIDVGNQSREDFTKLPDQFASVINKYCGGGDPSIFMLNCDNREVDLEYVSEKERQYSLDNPLGDESSYDAEGGAVQTGPATTEPSIRKKLEDFVQSAAKNIGIPEDHLKGEIEIEIPADPDHGDYSTNIAMRLGKILNRAPVELAHSLIQAAPLPDFVERIDTAGPGFINFHLSQSCLQSRLEEILTQKGKFGRLNIGEGQKVLVEYSSPNIAKPLGIHHLLSTILGQALADLHRAAGYEVVSLNWLGDWGTQFGKLLYAYKNWGDEEIVKKDPLNELLKLYVRFHDEAEKDPTMVDKGRAEFKKLEEGDEENLKLWEWMREVSILAITHIYDKLDVKFDEYLGEKMYLEDAQKILEEGKTKGVFTEGEQGAIIVKFENDKYPPYMMQKADGTTLYSTRDLASIRDRMERYHPQKILYVVDIAQKLHFQQLFETAHKLGMDGTEFIHVSFGRMLMPEGKMSTRKGDVILLDEVIKEATHRTEKIVNEKGRELTDEEKKRIIQGMAIGAIKYNIFSQNRETNITFEWDKMLSLEGNSGPYLQYAYARAKSILRKAEETPPRPSRDLKKDSQISIFNVEEDRKVEEEKNLQPFGHPAEQALLRLLPRFPEKIELAVRDNKPSVVTTYLFEVARAFSTFYSEVHVLTASKPELRQARLKLVRATAQILQNGLRLLGIDVFERM
ncbi:arginine--tRNA ligase [Patescibacteria group bacterium]|nr:arginine--tRNA ligase [Patescibacteria group bacterium]MBU1703357.1 arginine--tRNA ligase [Patescibacteria group bacterium]MBU1954203.1 arginine--tRNA ligase [Patescibacteria group bacterium]